MILVYNSKLGTMQKHYDKIKQDTAYLEQRLQERDNTMKERMRMLSESKLAIDDLFDRITNRSHVHGDIANPEMGLAALGASQASLKAEVPKDDKTPAEKLHALQFRILDLQGLCIYSKIAIIYHFLFRITLKKTIYRYCPNVSIAQLNHLFQ